MSITTRDKKMKLFPFVAALVLVFSSLVLGADGRSYLHKGKVIICKSKESGFTYSYNNDVFSTAITGFECALTKHHLIERIKNRNRMNGIKIKNINIQFATDVNGKRKPTHPLGFT